MSKKLYPESDIQNIANAIRALNGGSDTYTIGQMANAIALPENAYYLKSISGNPLSLTDGENNLKTQQCEVSFSPIQDLHGYDNPWVGGAGKQLVNITDRDVTVGGVNIKVKDGVITINGTSTGAINYHLVDNMNFAENSYTFSLSGNLSGNEGMIAVQTSAGNKIASNAGVTFTASMTGFMWFFCVAGKTFNNIVVKPMICLSTASEPTVFAPYSNICPISGRTEASVTRTGANQWDEQTRNGYYTPTGIFQSYSGNIATKNKIKVLPNTSYYFKCGSGNYFGRLCWYDANGNFVSTEVVQTANMTKTAPSNAYYLNFDMLGEYGTTYNDDISINYPSTDTNYHVYTAETHTHTYASTVYGGVDDFVSGEGSANMALDDMGTLLWRKGSGYFYSTSLSPVIVKNTPIYCDIFKNATTGDGRIANDSNGNLIVVASVYDDLSEADFKTAMTGHQICYELATTTQITNTPEDISLLKGVNVVSTDGDSLEVKYFSKSLT